MVATVLPRIQKESCIDYIVKGDPDETVVELALNGATETPGLTYRNPFGWVDAPSKPFIKDLDDPMFPLNQRRVIDIRDGILERGLKFEGRCEPRVDFHKQETLRAMAKAGCEGLNFGVESADVAIQQGVGRRPIDVEQFHKCVTLCRELGIKTFAFFIIGLPGDTIQTVLRTIKFAIDMKRDWVQFTAAAPFIGTKLRTRAVTRRSRRKMNIPTSTVMKCGLATRTSRVLHLYPERIGTRSFEPGGLRFEKASEGEWHGAR